MESLNYTIFVSIFKRKTFLPSHFKNIYSKIYFQFSNSYNTKAVNPNMFFDLFCRLYLVTLYLDVDDIPSF